MSYRLTGECCLSMFRAGRINAGGADLWNRTLANWPIGREETLLCCLRSACGALMRLRAAEEALSKHGGDGPLLIVRGQPRAHPLCSVIRDSSKQLWEDLKMRCLDWEILNQGKNEDDRDLEKPNPLRASPAFKGCSQRGQEN
jgi:hypothetical protein